jgi:hypothetical protein
MTLKTLGPRIAVLDARGHLEGGYLDYMCFSMTAYTMRRPGHP